VLDALIVHPDRPIAETVLLSSDDRAALRSRWRDLTGHTVDFAQPAGNLVTSIAWPDFLAAVRADGLLSALLLAL
jgi:hypothetical protein